MQSMDTFATISAYKKPVSHELRQQFTYKCRPVKLATVYETALRVPVQVWQDVVYGKRQRL
jgi:hypothetical protein